MPAAVHCYSLPQRYACVGFVWCPLLCTATASPKGMPVWDLFVGGVASCGSQVGVYPGILGEVPFKGYYIVYIRYTIYDIQSGTQGFRTYTLQNLM